VYGCGTLAHQQAVPLDDGRFNILVRGDVRIRIVDRSRACPTARTVVATPTARHRPDICPADVAAELSRQYFVSCRTRCPCGDRHVDLDALTNALIMASISTGEKQRCSKWTTRLRADQVGTELQNRIREPRFLAPYRRGGARRTDVIGSVGLSCLPRDGASNPSASGASSPHVRTVAQAVSCSRRAGERCDAARRVVLPSFVDCQAGAAAARSGSVLSVDGGSTTLPRHAHLDIALRRSPSSSQRRDAPCAHPDPYGNEVQECTSRSRTFASSAIRRGAVVRRLRSDTAKRREGDRPSSPGGRRAQRLRRHAAVVAGRAPDSLRQLAKDTIMLGAARPRREPPGNSP